jgi:hypothetical protein
VTTDTAGWRRATRCLPEAMGRVEGCLGFPEIVGKAGASKVGRRCQDFGGGRVSAWVMFSASTLWSRDLLVAVPGS